MYSPNLLFGRALQLLICSWGLIKKPLAKLTDWSVYYNAYIVIQAKEIYEKKRKNFEIGNDNGCGEAISASVSIGYVRKRELKKRGK